MSPMPTLPLWPGHKPSRTSQSSDIADCSRIYDYLQVLCCSTSRSRKFVTGRHSVMQFVTTPPQTLATVTLLPTKNQERMYLQTKKDCAAMKEETFLMRRPSLFRIQAKNAVINGWFLIFESIFTNLKSHRARTHFRYKGYLSSQVAIVVMKILKFQINEQNDLRSSQTRKLVEDEKFGLFHMVRLGKYAVLTSPLLSSNSALVLGRVGGR